MCECIYMLAVRASPIGTVTWHLRRQSLTIIFRIKISNQFFKSLISLFRYWIYSSYLRIFRNFIRLFNKSTFLFVLCDDFIIRESWQLSFKSISSKFRKETFQSNCHFHSTFSTMLTFVLRIKIARMNERNSFEFCRNMMRKSIEFHFLAKIR